MPLCVVQAQVGPFAQNSRILHWYTMIGCDKCIWSVRGLLWCRFSCFQPWKFMLRVQLFTHETILRDLLHSLQENHMYTDEGTAHMWAPTDGPVVCKAAEGEVHVAITSSMVHTTSSQTQVSHRLGYPFGRWYNA